MAPYRASDGAVLSYHDEGTGAPTILLIHGWLADSSVWTPLRGILAEHYRVITVDLRGSGGSNAAPGPYCTETFASDLADLIRARKLAPVVAVGHSSGALVAQRLATNEPDAVAAIALLAPVPASGWTFPPNVDAFMRAVPGNLQKTEAWLAGLTVAQPPPDIANILRHAAQTSSVRAALESYESWTHADFVAQAATIQIPIMLIAPEHDKPMTPDIIRDRVAGVLARARFVELSKAGHYAHIDQPQQTAALIEAFISTLP